MSPSASLGKPHVVQLGAEQTPHAVVRMLPPKESVTIHDVTDVTARLPAVQEIIRSDNAQLREIGVDIEQIAAQVTDGWLRSTLAQHERPLPEEPTKRAAEEARRANLRRALVDTEGLPPLTRLARLYGSMLTRDAVMIVPQAILQRPEGLTIAADVTSFHYSDHWAGAQVFAVIARGYSGSWTSLVSPTALGTFPGLHLAYGVNGIGNAGGWALLRQRTASGPGTELGTLGPTVSRSAVAELDRYPRANGPWVSSPVATANRGMIEEAGINSAHAELGSVCLTGLVTQSDGGLSVGCRWDYLPYVTPQNALLLAKGATAADQHEEMVPVLIDPRDAADALLGRPRRSTGENTVRGRKASWLAGDLALEIGLVHGERAMAAMLHSMERAPVLELPALS